MNGDEPPELNPLVIEITVDTCGITNTLHRVQAELMFAFHPDLSTAAERDARRAFMRAHSIGEDFKEQMEALHTHRGATDEELAGLRVAVLRLGDMQKGG